NLSLMAAFEEQADKLMDIMGEHVHAFIHLTKSSVHSFKTRYEGRAWVAAKPHYIAEHGHYEMYRRSSSPQEQLVPGHVSPYVLVFGGIRTRDEIEFCEEMALHLKEDGVTLVMAGPVSDHVMHWKVRKQLNRTCEGNIYRLHERVPTSAVYPMVANASAVLIPRSDRLNSGVQFLAITFGVPVVAPAMHSLGEVQRESGNPVYKEGDRKDAYETLRGLLSATALQRMGRRQQAFRYKHERMSWAMIARQHIAAYRAVLGSVG
ncbi:MAG: hypothetical protein JJ992_24330, partial [Planctomycetes bacterium]|nr:hypothetical protein [Planctomycetota bacterium]